MKEAFALLVFLGLSHAANAKAELTALAINCGDGTGDIEGSLTVGPEIVGVNGSLAELNKIASDFVKGATLDFKSMKGRVAVVLSPHTIISKIRNDDKICVIYRGTVVESKIIENK